jgi:hypothetical protein
MDDLMLSLYVLFGASLLAALVYLLMRRAAKRREEALAAYCAQNRFHLTNLREAIAREIRIEGDGWQLVSSMRAQHNSSEGGNSGWRRETEWCCTQENPLRQTFALQLSEGTSDFDRLPSWVRDAALSALRLWLGEEAQNLESVRMASFSRERTGVVFETKPHAADAALEPLRFALQSYHGALPLYLECSRVWVRLHLPGTAIATADEVEQLLRIARLLR